MSRAFTTERFVSDAQARHGNTYDYSLVEYRGSYIPVAITCKHHGTFSQAPHTHKAGQGCPSCAALRVGTKNRERGKRHFGMTHAEFETKASKKHNNKYQYRSPYLNCYTKVDVECPKHGIWKITPDTHLRGAGCPTCSHTSKYSQLAIKWLDTVAAAEGRTIQHAANGGEHTIPGTRLKVDGYCAETHTVYEFHGSRWHGDPSLFDPDSRCHPFDSAVTARELYDRTCKREQRIVSMGYKLNVMWESQLTDMLRQNGLVK